MKLARTVLPGNGICKFPLGYTTKRPFGARSRMADLQRAKRAAARSYFERPSDLSLSNIVGVGVGSKIKRGQFTETQAVRIYVAVKVDAGSVPKERLIPAELEGVPTDVVEIGRL